MKKIVDFTVVGLKPTPWTVPDIGNTVTKTGKKVRFARRPKKSRLASGVANLEDWQQWVAKEAREAMATVPLQTGPIRIGFEFYARTPPGKRHGELWDVTVAWNEEKEVFVKLGKNEPDLINLFKGTEDALEGIVFANDVQTRMISAVCLYGPFDGVRVTVHRIDADDFPGHGEPVACCESIPSSTPSARKRSPRKKQPKPPPPSGSPPSGPSS